MEKSLPRMAKHEATKRPRHIPELMGVSKKTELEIKKQNND